MLLRKSNFYPLKSPCLKPLGIIIFRIDLSPSFIFRHLSYNLLCHTFSRNPPIHKIFKFSNEVKTKKKEKMTKSRILQTLSLHYLPQENTVNIALA